MSKSELITTYQSIPPDIWRKPILITDEWGRVTMFPDDHCIETPKPMKPSRAIQYCSLNDLW